jgi:hypothetical protein
MSLTQYGPAPDLSSGISNTIWGDCRRDEIKSGVVRGIYYETDFVDWPLIGVQTAAIANGPLEVHAAAGGTIVSKSTINGVETPGGLLSLAVTAAAGNATVAQPYPSFLLSGSPNNTGKLWFETKLCWTGILANGLGWILGLAETEQFALAAGVPLLNTDFMTAGGGFIGFNKLVSGLGVINTVKSDRAAAVPTNIQAAAGAVTAAFQWVKLGMVYDPNNAAAAITFFVNGQKCANVVSNAVLQAYTYIDANCLGFIFSEVAGSAGTTSEAFLDWVKIYQELP